VFCSKCGTQLNEGSSFCSKCGAPVGPIVGQVQLAEGISPKSQLATSLLAWFLGEFGAHRFYVGKNETAVVMLAIGLAAGGDYPIWALLVIGALLYFAVWVWSVIDFIIAVTGNFKDKQGKPIKKW
jgi:TM2 domain-containing membrane protein YozV